ncbi:MAG: low molecular weight protein-tyrosine-phosphatase [Ignavibacteriaceae bacterium]
MKKALFVCLGNICRSPAAEGIFKKFVNDKKLDSIISVDSAGTIAYHQGELPDKRMRKIAFKKGYTLNSRARKFDPDTDFENFDYIVTMDNNNYEDLMQLDKEELYKNKILKMADFIDDKEVAEVPDPYYGGDKEFEYVIGLLENGSKNLLNKIKTDIERRDKK